MSEQNQSHQEETSSNQSAKPKGNRKTTRMFHFLYLIIWPFFNLCHPVRVIGREKIPQGPALVCPNHSSIGDPFYVVFAFGYRYPMWAMAKIQIMRVPVIGFLLSKAGVFGVDRGHSDIKAVKTALRCLKEGNKLLIFPEGTRVEEGENVEAKGGVVLFSTRTGAPIIPVYVPTHKPWFHPVTVVIGDPYHPQIAGRRPTNAESHAISKDLMDRIHRLKELEP